MKKLLLGFAALILTTSIASAQGLWNNFPIVGGDSYCSSYVNSNCSNTVPAGPSALTGNEEIPADTNLSGGRFPQTVLVKPASLNANPITFVTVTSSSPAGISASNIQGGVYYTATGTITSANITLPSSAIHGQQFRISANRTITTLSVTAASGDTMVANSAPTVMTASTTSVQGYTFVCNKTSGACAWGRLQ